MERIIRKLIRNIEKLPANFNEKDAENALRHLLKQGRKQKKISNIIPDIIINDKKGKPLHAIELKVRRKGGYNSNPVDFFSECGEYHGGRDNIYQCRKLLGIKKGTVIYIYKMNKPEDSKITKIKQAKSKICKEKKYSFIRMHYLEFMKNKFYKGLLIHKSKITSPRV